MSSTSSGRVGLHLPRVRGARRARLDSATAHEGLGGVVLYAWNVESREQLAR